jgi:hypothetical protein
MTFPASGDEMVMNFGKRAPRIDWSGTIVATDSVSVDADYDDGVTL